MLAFPVFCPSSIVVQASCIFNHLNFSNEVMPDRQSLCQITMCETKTSEQFGAVVLSSGHATVTSHEWYLVPWATLDLSSPLQI